MRGFWEHCTLCHSASHLSLNVALAGEKTTTQLHSGTMATSIREVAAAVDGMALPNWSNSLRLSSTASSATYEALAPTVITDQIFYNHI